MEEKASPSFPVDRDSGWHLKMVGIFAKITMIVCGPFVVRLKGLVREVDSMLLELIPVATGSVVKEPRNLGPNFFDHPLSFPTRHRAQYKLSYLV